LSHDSVIAAGSQIIEFTSQTELPVLERQSPLTVLVAESAFADWLIQFLGNSEVEQLVWDILQLLPTAQSVENEFDNVGHIIDILASPLPRFAFRYRFQPLRLFLARDPAANHEFCEKGLEILIRNLLTSPDLSLFRCLQVFEDKHWIPFIPTVLPKLLGLMNMDFEDVFMNEVVTLAWALAQADVRSFQHALALNFDVLEEIVMKDNHTTFTPVEEFVKDFENPFPFFERMVARLSVDSPGSLFAVLQGLTEQLRPSHDLTILTDQCQRILRTAETSKITRVFDLMKVLQCCDQDLLKELIQKAFENGNGQFLRSVLSLLKHQQQNLVEPFLDVQLGRYQYDPDLEKKNFFVGLRNLGATCYMNSVLQQLFGINAFLNQVLQYQFDKRDGRELQRLFVRLLLSDRKFADTQSFVAVWEGWGNSTVNPREQQDVNEFFELFLDSMPVELRQLFKGKIIHRFDGITEDFHSSTLEEFTAFGLPVRGYDDIDYPLRAFIDVETFTGFYAEDLGRKIDVRKTSRIQEPPEILVVHLRRFEYDHARRQRVKINDDCIFPQVLLMNEFTSDPKTECIYHLRGIILHTGTAQGGHYRSLMRVDDNWFEFSDCEVTSCPELSNSSTFDENLRALYCRNETACYLLFYEKNPQTKRETPFIPKDLEREVLDDNKEFWKIQNLFSNVFYSFIFECDSPILLTKYFWTVFCHSSRIQDLPVMAAELRRCIRDRRAFADFVINHAEAVTDAISSVSDQDVMNELTNLVHEFLSVIPLEKRFPFYDGFVAKFGTIMNLWRNAITLGGLPSMFVQHSECAKLAVSRKWPEICSELIQKFYQITTSQFVLQRVDFTQLLSILQRCRQYIEDPEPIFQPLIAIRHLFIQSSAHKPKFVDAVLHDRDLAALLSRILSGKSNVGDVSSELFATNFDVGDACELVKAWLAQVRGRDGPVTEVLITNYHELVVPLLLSPSPEVRWNAENLTYDLMPAAKPPRCRFNEFCRKGIWNPRVDCAERGKQLSDDRLLQILLEKSIPFVVEITNLASSAYGSRLQSFLSVLRWLVKRLGRLDGCVFASVWDLYGNLRDCNCHEDFNFVTCVQTILVFPPALVEPVFQSVAWNCFEKFPTFVEDLYSPLFTKCKQLSTGAVIGALHKSEMHDVFRTATASKAHGMIDLFRHVLPILMPSDARFRDCVFERMAELLQEPSFPAPILSLAGVAFPFLGRREIAKLCEMAIKWSNPELFTILGAQIQARADLTFDSISVDCSRIRVDDQNAEFLAVLCHRCPQFSGSAAQSGSAADFLLKVFRTADECEKFVEDGIVPTINRETPAHVFGGLREAARRFGRPRWAVSVAHEAIASGVSADSLRGLVGDLVGDGEFADEVVALVVQLVEQVSEVAVTLAGRPLELLAEIVAAADCHSKELIRTLIDDQISEEQVATLSDMWPAECTRVLRDSM
jgi:ubiquitin C-terminal hydrolase